MAVLSDGMLRGYFEQQLPTLGEIVLRSKQSSMDDSRFAKQLDSKSQLGMINSIATAMVPKNYDLKAERQEHVWQINLLGDPLMRMSYPKSLEFAVSQTTVQPGEQIRFLGAIPFAGKLQLEIAQRRGVPTEEVRQAKVDWQTDQGREAFENRYRAANRQALAQSSIQVEPGQSSLELQIPESLKPGKYIVRAFLEGAAGFSAGYQEIRVAAKNSNRD
jgi:hypothetical protein